MKDINNETKRRIDMMNSAEYEFPPRFEKKDYIITGIAVLICIAAVIGGAFL